MTDFTVRYFAAAAEVAGVDAEQWDSEFVSSLASLRVALCERHGDQMTRIVRSGTFLVNGVSREETELENGFVVDVLPPFAGG
ncbi:MoaD/ThiS family protein [Leucobacter sp. Z1108]|uniref:MoaD/ThiS family protein n=1 Tax=unclassified Leucobacter TaxID=2621730 RepID=UPI003D9955EC